MTDTTEAPIEDRTVPTTVATALGHAAGTDDPPATLGEWVDATAALLVDEEFSASPESLCLTEESRHEARVDGETHHFRCVLDALMLPFLLEGAGTVEVRSRSPVSDAVVEVELAPEGASTDPEGAVVSFGLVPHDPAAADRDDQLAYGYEAFCPYVNAFPDRAEYEEWAAETDAETMALGTTEAVDLAELLVDRLTD